MIKFSFGLLLGILATYSVLYIENRKKEMKLHSQTAAEAKNQLVLTHEQTLAIDVVRTLVTVGELFGNEKIAETRRIEIANEVKHDITKMISDYKIEGKDFSSTRKSTDQLLQHWTEAFKTDGNTLQKIQKEVLNYLLENKIELSGIIQERHKQLDLKVKTKTPKK
jgi:hypothetical protein